MTVLCHRCAFEALDGPEYTSPDTDDMKFDVPARPAIVCFGRSWCMEHFVEEVLDALDGGLE